MTTCERLVLLLAACEHLSCCSYSFSQLNVSVLQPYYCLKYLVSCIDVCLFLRCHLLSCPLPLLFSGVISVSLSVVLGVEEDQSESALAHAWHERCAHHPAFCADQVDQENDWWDHCMSAERCQEEYLKQRPLEHSLKNKINHINELLHFIWTILRGESYFLFLFCFIEALHVNYQGIGRPQEVVLGRTHSGVIVGVETQSCHRTARAGMWSTEHMDNGLTSPTVCPWHKLMK